MTSRGAKKNYDFREKNRWRRSVWRDLKKRSPRRAGPVLYLCGPEGLDEDVAVECGFSRDELMAIDIDPGNVDACRKRGGIAICGDALDVLWSWPLDFPVSAVFMDFCAGIVRDTVDVFDPLMANPSFSGAPIALNFMRGRDPGSNSIRKILDAHGLLGKLYRDVPHLGLVEVCNSSKNRALQYMAWHILESSYVASGVLPGGGREGDRVFPVPVDLPERCKHVARFAVGQVMHRLGARFRTYKSGVLRFDSVVYRLPVIPASLHGGEYEFSSFTVSEVRRKISAARALRTMKLRRRADR